MFNLIKDTKRNNVNRENENHVSVSRTHLKTLSLFVELSQRITVKFWFKLASKNLTIPVFHFHKQRFKKIK